MTMDTEEQKIAVKFDHGKHHHQLEGSSNLPEINVSPGKNKAPSSFGGSGSPRGLTKPASARWNCLCSPTTHAGSFRCRFHRNAGGLGGMVRGRSVGSHLSELASKSRPPLADLV